MPTPCPQPWPLNRKSVPEPGAAATHEPTHTGGRSSRCVEGAAAAELLATSTAAASVSARRGIGRRYQRDWIDDRCPAPVVHLLLPLANGGGPGPGDSAFAG